jgi:hypothetical protein
MFWPPMLKVVSLIQPDPEKILPHTNSFPYLWQGIIFVMWGIPGPTMVWNSQLNCRSPLPVIVFTFILSFGLMGSALWVHPPQKWIPPHTLGWQRYGWMNVRCPGAGTYKPTNQPTILATKSSWVISHVQTFQRLSLLPSLGLIWWVTRLPTVLVPKTSSQSPMFLSVNKPTGTVGWVGHPTHHTVMLLNLDTLGYWPSLILPTTAAWWPHFYGVCWWPGCRIDLQ